MLRTAPGGGDNRPMPRFLSILLVSFALPFAAQAAPRNCLVVGVSDGDTLKVRCGSAADFRQIKVRLSAIDAPERGQPYGERARQAMSALVYRKDVDLDCIDTDRYGRSVCKVFVAPASAPAGPRTLDAGLAMLTLGMAWWYRHYAWEQTPQERGQHEFAEAEAKARRIGLWRDADPLPPWDWRRSARHE